LLRTVFQFRMAGDRDDIIEKIRKVEALFARAASDGERQAAGAAIDRLRARLDAAEPEEEFQFTLPDPWKRQMFLALARRLGLRPYRRPRQRQSTIMLRLTRKMVDQTLWPQYCELSKILHDYLAETTREIITRAVHGDVSEAPEQPVLPG
jgi:hypothetical protein